MHDVGLAKLLELSVAAPHLRAVRSRRQICPIFISDLDIVIFSFSVEVLDGKIDDLADSNLDGLGRVMVVGITPRVVGRRQDPTRW